MEAQLVLELVGNTALACMLDAPSLIIPSKVGVVALFNPSGLSPSKPITTTCFTKGEFSRSFLAQDQNEPDMITNTIVLSNNSLVKTLCKLPEIAENKVLFSTILALLILIGFNF